MNFSVLLFFCLVVIGFTNVIVDPATIFLPARNYVSKRSKKNLFWAWFDKLLSCYQCAGFWVGIIAGIILISLNPFVVFLCGMAGSFVATWGAAYLNYLEARSVVADLSDE
jgi:hypothetical protein